MTTIYEMNDDELKEFLNTYEVGEVLSTEAEIDYVMGRLPEFFGGYRPVLVDYSFTEKDREIFKRLGEEGDRLKAMGFDIDEEF